MVDASKIKVKTTGKSTADTKSTHIGKGGVRFQLLVPFFPRLSTVKKFQGRTNEYTRWPGHGINGHGQKWLNKDDHV